MTGNKENINNFLKSIPEYSGVYKFYDSKNKLLYIGKAKNLKKRVKSYFNKEAQNYKIKKLVIQIDKIEYIIVENEQEALLLENNLIKQFQPKYNIQLKDDKTFPWICIKNERFPKVFTTRNRIEDGSIYFGPYTSANMVRTLLELIRNIYPIRNCNYNLSIENIENKKIKACLEYQIGNCKGPCEGLHKENDYNEGIENIKKILKGNLKEVIVYLNDLMEKYSERYKYEEAEKIKQKKIILEKFQSKSTIVNPEIKDIDVFSIASDINIGVVNYLKVVNGAIVQSHTLEIKKKLDETDEELLLYGITDIYLKINSEAKEILLPFDIKSFYFNKKKLVPKIGDKKKLIDLSLRNAIQYRIEKEKKKNNVKEKSSEFRILNTIKIDLKLNNIPYYIECFDNSNIQGTNPVSSCVVFRNGKPSKREYRHYNIMNVKGIDDYTTMQEVITRRYERLLKENQQLPNLIIIDGGKGQLNAAHKILKKMNLDNKIAIVGIAKRLEEIFYPNDSVPIYLNKKSETLKIIQYARNEAHRFGISHHRGRRSKEMIVSELDNIKGIGEKTKTILLRKYNSVTVIRKVKIEELEKIIGKSKAELLYSYLNKEK